MKKKLLSFIICFAFGLYNLSFGQVSNYTFAQAAGTPTLLTATYTQHTSGTTDYATYTAVPIGFTFQFDCNPYTTVSISNDGYIVMGSSIWGTTTPISSASENNVISAMAGDLVGLAGASLRSKTAGSAPNRTFTVEWKNYARWSNGGDMTFQIILYETTNVIEMVYTTATALTTASDFQTGLAGATNADFNNRTKATNAAWTASGAGGTNAAVMSCGTTVARCPTGLYTWTPPGCSGTPTAGTTAASPTSVCGGESTDLSITGGATGCGLTYQWQSSPDNSVWSNIGGATATTYTASPGSNTYYRRITTCTASGLSANSTSVLVSIINCVILGTGTSTTTYPYNGNWHDARSQYIISASELIAAGFCGGSSLTSLAFNVSSKNSSAVYNGFTLKMGHTTATNFPSAAWLTPAWTNVYSANWTTSVGWNVHTFSTSFVWNGTDNVVVETCFNNTGYTSNDPVYYTTTAATTVCYAYADGVTGCTMAASYTSTSRPNMKFNYVVGPPCAGTPTGGTSTATPASICVGDNSTLSLTGQTIGCGITLQWQSSPNPVTVWTNIAGATGASYVASPTVSTNYRCLVTCTNSGLSAASTVSLVTIPVVVPNCATYTSPANGATNITCGLNAIMNWTAPTVTACNPATSYDVYFGTNPAPPFVVNQTGLMYNPGTLLPSTTYYWRIVPRNANGPAVCATVWSFSTGASYNASQTTPPIIDGFENCTDWTVVNGAQPNVWINGSATSFLGTNSMYIHNGGGTDNDYAHTTSIVHFYKDITFPAGANDYDLNFYWKGEGESSYDYLQVFLAPTTVTPVAGTQVNSSYSITPYVYLLSGGVWQYYSEKLAIACGGNETKRLIFSWKNDGSGGTQPPAAVDDIQLIMTPRTGTTCANPVNINLPYAATGQTTQCYGDDYNNTAVPCAGNNYVLDEDKVYKALIGAAGCVNITITNASSSSIGFQVYDACPDAGGTCVYNSTTGASGGVLSADINIPAPGFYYIMVDSWSIPANYVDYDINISAPGGNTLSDPCTGAIPLTLGISSSGDNTCTNAVGEPAKPACWTTGNMNTVWYRVTIPASRDLIIQTTAGSLLKTQIDFYRGNSCAGLTYVDCNQDAASCGTGYDHSQYYLENIGAGTYLYIRVDGENNLVGTFSIIAMDGNNVAAPGPPLPPIVGQDCGPVLTYTFPVCGQNNYVPNPGNFAYGNICDFTGAGPLCLASGEKSSTWYTININANGTLAFDIVPNDWPGSPSTVATDYDWALWRWEPTCDGLGDNTFCCTEISAGTTAATRCNYSGLGVTGMYTTAGTSPAAYPGFGSAYDANLAVTNGEIYVLVISNFKNDYTSGYSLNFSAGSPIAYSTPGATMTWSSSTSNTWTSAGNWGGCGPPNCGINGVIAAGGAQPVVNSNVTVKDLTIDAGAVLTINPGVTITICGNLTNNGTLIAAPTSTILFDNASVTHTISGNLTGTNKLGNLTINKTGGSVVLTCNLDIGGNFTTQNTTSILNVANYYLKVGGNFSTASNVTITNCPTIEFNGVIPQTYTNNSGTLTFPNVVMNNTGGGLILTGTTTSNLYVSTALTLTNGIIYTANPPLLVLNAGSTSTSGSALSFVDGPMQKIGNTAFVFPMGDAFNRWMRIAITAPTAVSTFQAQYFYTPYASLTPMAVTPTPVLNNVSAIEYWQLDRVAGTGNARVTLYWENAASSGINSCAALQGGDLVVGRWNGTAWENRSNSIVGGITGTCGTFGTVQSDVITAFSPFTFSSKSAVVNPLPVELLSFTGNNNVKENVLEWITATEVNNDYFTLERGTDGYSFKEIATIKGDGNSNTIKKYKSLDKEPLNGINYYRLKQTDFDGTVKYAPNVVALKNEKDVDYTLYPNPVNNQLIIYADLMDQESINITITDISGRKVMEQKQFIIGGGNSVTIDASQFSEGVYFVLLNRENSTIISQKKFVKMK